MARKGMNIYKRKDGRWEGRLKIDGGARYISLYGKTYTEAREKLLRRQKDDKPKTASSRLSFREVSDIWLAGLDERVKCSTKSNYYSKLRLHILPRFAALRYDKITREMAEEFILERRRSGRAGGGGLSDKYVGDILALLKNIGGFAAKSMNLPNPFAHVTAPKIPKTKPKILSTTARNQLTVSVLSDPDQTSIGVLLSLYTGIRLGEVCALKWGQIDLQTQIIHVEKTAQRVKLIEENKTRVTLTSPKTADSFRDVPIPDFLLKLLAGYEKPRDCFFLSGSERIVEPRLMQYRFKSLLKKAFLPSINYHALRHTFATSCIANGVDVKTVADILGHSAVEITMNLYVHPTIERKRDCVNKAYCIP